MKILDTNPRDFLFKINNNEKITLEDSDILSKNCSPVLYTNPVTAEFLSGLNKLIQKTVDLNLFYKNITEISKEKIK